MRILDKTTDKSANNICLYLTLDEANQLRDFLSELIEDPNQHHTHVEDFDSEKELTVAVYTESNLHQFDARSRRLIAEDK
jgi:hypothetical protein